MSGIIAVYALVISVLVAGNISPDESYPLFNAFLHLAAGLSVGLAGLAAGYAIGIVGDTASLGPSKRNTTVLTGCRESEHTCSNRGYLSVWF
jgi:F0F1-type ATP synthase membrane subunit c/vacuolar-type H+-ATPase subunit K